MPVASEILFALKPGPDAGDFLEKIVAHTRKVDGTTMVQVGFIQPDGGGNDVFVHITAVQKAGLQGLDENAKVEYELENQRGKTAAVDLKVL